MDFATKSFKAFDSWSNYIDNGSAGADVSTHRRFANDVPTLAQNGSDRSHATASLISFHEQEQDTAEKIGLPKGAMNTFCFPASARVYVKGRGPVGVADLYQGDMLLAGDAGDGSLHFSPFLDYLHIGADETCDFVELGFTTGAPLSASREHLVFVTQSGENRPHARKACECQVGDIVSRVGCDGVLNHVRIASKENVSRKGYYAPLTRAGTLVVDGTLCSCYADPLPANYSGPWRLLGTHEVLHQITMPLVLAYDFSLERMIVAITKVIASGFKSVYCHSKPLPDLRGVHPYCQALLALPTPACT